MKIWSRRFDKPRTQLTGARLFSSVQEILSILCIEGVELILRTDTTVQGLAILPELNIGEPRRNAAIAVGIEGIDVDGSANVAAGINDQRIGDLHLPSIHDTRLFLTGGVDEVAVLVGRIVRAIHVAIAQRQLQIGAVRISPKRK